MVCLPSGVMVTKHLLGHSTVQYSETPLIGTPLRYKGIIIREVFLFKGLKCTQLGHCLNSNSVLFVKVSLFQGVLGSNVHV